MSEDNPTKSPEKFEGGSEQKSEGERLVEAAAQMHQYLDELNTEDALELRGQDPSKPDDLWLPKQLSKERPTDDELRNTLERGRVAPGIVYRAMRDAHGDTMDDRTDRALNNYLQMHPIEKAFGSRTILAEESSDPVEAAAQTRIIRLNHQIREAKLPLLQRELGAALFERIDQVHATVQRTWNSEEGAQRRGELFLEMVDARELAKHDATKPLRERISIAQKTGEAEDPSFQKYADSLRTMIESLEELYEQGPQVSRRGSMIEITGMVVETNKTDPIVAQAMEKLKQQQAYLRGVESLADIAYAEELVQQSLTETAEVSIQ